MSISPVVPLRMLFSGHIHREDCRPARVVAGNLARTSKRPQVWEKCPYVATWLEEIWVWKLPVGVLHVNGVASLRVVSDSTPLATEMLFGELTKQPPAAVWPFIAVVTGSHLAVLRDVPVNSSSNEHTQAVPFVL